ncbi:MULTISPECIES: alpha/beta hydrolase family protein [Nocardia]|uniref:alpha/beta hydrolase family protein n=1 Tax=Nocardia TaxID=1817 RepID=UPI0003110DCF|nr:MULTISPECIES: alpha/beta hydrolase fold domain-containing protein [Nocardia]
MVGVEQGGARRWVMAGVLAVVVAAIGFGSVEPAAPDGHAGPAVPGLSIQPAEAGVPIRIAYGREADTFGDLYLPAGGPLSGSSGRCPVVVLIHGGGWAQYRDLTQFSAQARQLAESGVAVWNVEYRRVNGAGGWPVTLTDVDDAVAALGTVVQQRAGGRLDLDNVHLAGHSAGGQLAAWVAGRRTDGEAASRGLRIRSVTLMAAVLDLDYAVAHGNDGFVRKLLGGLPDEVPDRYRYASPIVNLPRGVHVTAVHGDADRVVSVEQSRRYAEAARRAGDPTDLHILPGVGHAEFTDPGSAAWSVARVAILASVAESA